MWASNYLQIPFQAHGRTHDGCDCWGLVRLVYAEQRGVDLPDFDGISPDDAERVPQAIDEERRGWREVPFEERQEFDIVVMRARLVIDGKAMSPDMHIGIVTPDRRILHTQLPFGVACVAADHPTIVNRVSGVYRK